MSISCSYLRTNKTAYLGSISAFWILTFRWVLVTLNRTSDIPCAGKVFPSLSLSRYQCSLHIIPWANLSYHTILLLTYGFTKPSQNLVKLTLVLHWPFLSFSLPSLPPLSLPMMADIKHIVSYMLGKCSINWAVSLALTLSVCCSDHCCQRASFP